MPLAPLIDTHCHLDLEPLAALVPAVLERARAAGVSGCLSLGTSLESSRATVELARRHPMLRAGVGVHPELAETATDATLAELERLADESCVGAIGEVGLDDYREHAPMARQVEVLAAFAQIARRCRLPLAIHCRGTEAYGALLGLLRREGMAPWRGVLHCASGTPEFIRAVLELGLHVSFAGNVTFPSARALHQLVPLVPDDRLLVETDAPFLAPQPVRGQTNEPGHVAHTAAWLAAARGDTIERLAQITTDNARRLFGFPANGVAHA